MKKPMVSIVMSCYNHQKYVGEAIDSVLAQTYTDFEFLIVDDGSIDGSAEVIAGYDDERMIFYPCPNNTAFAAWEEVSTLAKGKYIAGLGSDDMWKSDKLEKQIAFLESHPEYDACFTWVETINEDSKVMDGTEEKTQWFNYTPIDSAALYKKLFMEGNSLAAPSFVLRNEVFQELGGYHFKYRQLQDYDLWMRYLHNHKLYIMPEKLLLYRWHESDEHANISAASDATIVRDRNEMMHIFRSQIEDIPDELFVEAFADNLMRKSLNTHEEVMCEKFLLMLNHPRTEAQQVGIDYYLTHIDEVKFADCLENIYGFSRADFFVMEVNRGLMLETQNLENAVKESCEMANKVIAYAKI